MPNQRISELDESNALHSNDTVFNTQYQENSGVGDVNDWFLMLARPKISNEIISIPNFNLSVLKDAVYLKGDQRISGQKTFKDVCHITKRANIHSIQDLSEDGPISGYTFVSSSGSFEKVITGTGESSGHHDLSVAQGAVFENDLKISGSISFPGKYESNNFSSKNLEVRGSAIIENGVSITGTFETSEDLNISLNTSFSGDITESKNLYARENITSSNNQKLTLTPDRIQFSSGVSSFIDIKSNDIEFKDIIGINKENLINFSSSTPSGKIYVEGTGYVGSINALNNGTYRSFFGGDDESMVFKSFLQPGFSDFTISLPKTFLEEPVICTSLQHITSGTIIPYIISEVNQNQFKVKFGQNINDENFVLHTTAMAPSSGEYTSNKKGFQRFKTPITSGVNYQTITYPEKHVVTPTISLNIQGENEIVPYILSGVNTTNYTIVFSADTPENYILHTISTDKSNQRIS
jgi:hypothetical protein